MDGFNLYYRALRKMKFKWLNLEALMRELLSADNDVQRIRYFTAPVSGKFDPSVPVRQQRYLQALRSLPTVSIHEGNFLTRRKVRPLANPAPGGPTHVEVWNTEEKGSDVNLAGYGEALMEGLAQGLTSKYGRGFTRKNLGRMVQFVEVFPDAEIVATLWRQLRNYILTSGRAALCSAARFSPLANN